MKKKLIIKAAILAAAALVLLAVGLAILHNRDASEHADTRSESPEGFGELKTVTWEGKTYREKPAVTTILFVGTARHGDPDATGSKTYRRGSPADFLLLVAIDHTSKQIH